MTYKLTVEVGGKVVATLTAEHVLEGSTPVGSEALYVVTVEQDSITGAKSVVRQELKLVRAVWPMQFFRQALNCLHERSRV